jgi:hypothetical protein
MLIRNVRFTPQIGHIHRRHQCLLSANSGHLRPSDNGASRQRKDRLTVAKDWFPEVALALAVVVVRATVPAASVCFRGSRPAGLA